MNIIKNKKGKIIRFELTEADYRSNANMYIGLCLNCGQERETCEGDARNYPCDDGCGQNEVFGTEELLVMGQIEIVE